MKLVCLVDFRNGDIRKHLYPALIVVGISTSAQTEGSPWKSDRDASLWDRALDFDTYNSQKAAMEQRNFQSNYNAYRADFPVTPHSRN